LVRHLATPGSWKPPSRYAVVYGVLSQVRTAVSNIAVTIIHTSTVIPFKSFHVIQHHAGSLHTFMSGQILNPYLVHYRPTFAFSSDPLPASPWVGLAVNCPSFEGEIRAYQVPLLTHNGLASVCPPEGS
jgi:hypothetical protein